jgi:hypothetical protein
VGCQASSRQEIDFLAISARYGMRRGSRFVGRLTKAPLSAILKLLSQD